MQTDSLKLATIAAQHVPAKMAGSQARNRSCCHRRTQKRRGQYHAVALKSPTWGSWGVSSGAKIPVAAMTRAITTPALRLAAGIRRSPVHLPNVPPACSRSTTKTVWCRSTSLADVVGDAP